MQAFVPPVPGAPGGSLLCVGPLAAQEAAPCPGTPTSQGLLPHPSWSFPFSTPCLWASLRLGNPSMPGPLKWEPHWACRLPAFKGAQNELQPHRVVGSGRWGAENGLPAFSLEVSEPQKSTEASSPSFPIACWSSLSRVSRSPCIQPSNLLLKPCWMCLLKQAPGSVSITLNFCFDTPSTALFPDLLAVSRDHGTCSHHPLLPDALQMQSAPSNRPQHCRRRGHDSLVSQISAQPKQETCLISASVSSCKG